MTAVSVLSSEVLHTNKKIVRATVELSDSYDTGGEPVVAADFGLQYVEFVFTADDWGEPIAASRGGVLPVKADENDWRLFLLNSQDDEVSAATDLSTAEVDIFVIGV